jgi:transcriptional regulator with XRE-family HTH domain
MDDYGAVGGATRDDRPAAGEVWRDWMRQFGRHVRRVREFLGLSQDELARRAGVSQGAVSRFEGGRGINTPFLVILRLNMALARQLKAMDPETLNDEVRKFLRHMDFLSQPIEPGGPPAPGGVPLPELPVTADPDIERLVRQYRALPEGQRRAFKAALASLVEERG